MPKDTFHNLPADKRTRVLTAAYKEFALHDFRNASVSRIVDEIGIAKGSLYQYFADKKDLYLYLVTSAAETKFAFINSNTPSESDGFFERFETVVFLGAQFDFSNPVLGGILYNVTYESRDTELLDIALQLRRSSLDFIEGLVDAGSSEASIRGDIDRPYVVFALYQLTISLRDYLSERFNFSFKDAVEKGEGSPISARQLRSTIRLMLDLFRRGIAAG